jgi:hypothetical protein
MTDDDEASSEDAKTTELLDKTGVDEADTTSELIDAKVAEVIETRLEEANMMLELGVADTGTLSEVGEARLEEEDETAEELVDT